MLSKLGRDFVVNSSWTGEKAVKGKSVGHFKCNYLILFLWRLDTKFLETVKEHRYQFSSFKGPLFPELPAVELQVSVSDLGLQGVAGGGQVY